MAPPGRHLLVTKDTVRLSRGPRQNGVRPAADPLFRSAALHAGPRVTAVVLSGALDDAALGSATVERLGGQVMVQDPADCDYDSMPRNAISVTDHPIIVPTTALAGEVIRLASVERKMERPDAPEPDGELAAEISGLLAGSPETNTRSRTYSDLTCPECGGPLYHFDGERAETYDCLVGHRWSPQSLFEEQSASAFRTDRPAQEAFRKASPAPYEPGDAATWTATWTEVSAKEKPGGGIEGAALSSGPVVQLAIDLTDKLRVANAAAEALFNLRPRDLGRPFQDLEVSYRPVELRSRIEQVREQLRPVELDDVEWQRPGGVDVDYYDVAIVPLFAAPGDLVGVGISFVDVTRYRRVRDELAHANTELERAYEELQSLNEELETTNEEFQSTNDELQVINEELRGRSEELDQTNSFLGSVLRSLGSGVIVLNDELRVRVWSPGAEDLWGLRPEEAESKELLSLDIGLPVAEIEPMLRRVLGDAAHGGTDHGSTGHGSTGAAPVQHVSGVNRRGKTVELQVAASPMRTEEGGISGVILVIEQSAS